MNDRVSITMARENLAELVGRVQYGGERIVLERRGKAVGALVSAADVEWLEAMEDARLVKIVEDRMSEPDYDPNDTVPAEEFFASLRQGHGAE